MNLFSDQDEAFLHDKGISIEQAERNIEMLKSGLPGINLSAPAMLGKGILKVDAVETEKLHHVWDDFLNWGGDVIKMVPASGAATRMFKSLYSFLESNSNQSDDPEVKHFFENIEDFAFFPELQVYLDSLSLDDPNYFYKAVSRLLDKSGLGYGILPKGLLHFHKYKDRVRTSFEEHIAEGCMYAKNCDNIVNLHFTVSPQHLEKFLKLEKQVKPLFERNFGAVIKITYSEQSPSTDTLAVDENDEPFRESSGELLLRPGGHGALIKNLNDLSNTVIFIKNIDNVVPDKLKTETVKYKKAIGGILINIKNYVHSLLEKLDEGNFSFTTENISKVEQQLMIKFPQDYFSDVENAKTKLYKILNRPIRVCGMVKNEGEPGGGPFWVKDKNGVESLQIVESSQVDTTDSAKVKIFESSTHFNPVDLVCYTKNYKGQKFNLKEFVDEEAAFISLKSKDGKPLKALELPGLWNGAMANWITIFVEVPAITFNPVKTVNDLLRQEHQ